MLVSEFDYALPPELIAQRHPHGVHKLRIAGRTPLIQLHERPDIVSVRVRAQRLGRTPLHKRVRVLEAGQAAYSDLAVVPDRSVGDAVVLCLYETGEATPYETLRLARVPIGWLR